MERGKHYEKNKRKKEKKKEKLLIQEGLIDDISESLSNIKEESSTDVSDKLNDLEIKINRLGEYSIVEISKLKQENKELKQENKELKQKVAELEQKVDKKLVKQENKELKQEELKQKVVELEQENKKLKQENKELKQKVAELEQKVAELEQKFEIVQNELDIQKVYRNYRDWVSDLNITLEIKMDFEDLYGKILKEQRVRKSKNLPQFEGPIVSQLIEVLEKAKVGFTFKQYMKLQEFRKESNFNAHVGKYKSINKAREELKNTIFPGELKHLKAPLYKLFDLLEVINN